MIITDKKTDGTIPGLDEIPSVISQLSCDVKTVIEHMLVANKELSRIKGNNKVWLTVEMLQDYLPTHPAKQTIYGWMQQRAIPFYKGEKTTLFLKSDIDEWLSVRHIVPDWWNDRSKFLLDAKQ